MAKRGQALRRSRAIKRPAKSAVDPKQEIAALRRELAQEREQRAATSDVLAAISRSNFQLQAVLDTIAETAGRLCEAEFAVIWKLQDGKYVFAAANNAADAFVKYAAEHPIVPVSGTIIGRVARHGKTVHMPDCLADPDYAALDLQTVGKHRTMLGVPLLRDGRMTGVIVLNRMVVKPFTEAQIELVTTFTDQAVIAIENTRLFDEVQARTDELSESLQQQTAVSDVLKVISRSTFDLQPVLETLVKTAARLCTAEMAVILLRDGGVYRAGAAVGFSPEYVAFLESHPHAIDRGSMTGRVAIEKRIIQVDDVTADPEYRHSQSIALAGQRTALGVPLLREGEVTGVIVLARQRVEPFGERQIELVRTFADQAVIAIENTRLLTEQREALERQTATAEVLQVINSSPGDLAPVFEAILEKAHRLCGVAHGSLQLHDGNGCYRAVAARGLSEAWANRLRQGFTLGPNAPGHRLLEGARFVQMADLAEMDEPIARAAVELGGIRTALFIPLRKDGTLLGRISATRQEVKPFTEKEIALLESFAAQAVIAMENARLITETREALEQQTATAEVLQVINSSPGDLRPVLDAMLDKAMRLCGAAFGYLDFYDRERFRTAVMHGAPAAFEQFRQHNPPVYGPGTGHARLIAGEPFVHIVDLMAEEVYRLGEPNRRAVVDLGGARTLLGVPLRKQNALLGALWIYRQEVRPFSDKQVALVQNFAAQAVIAIDNARLITETREALEQQTATAEVLQVINSSPGDLAPVFDAILEKAHNLCGATRGALQLYDGDKFRAVAVRGQSEAFAHLLRQGYSPGPNNPERPLLEGARFAQVADLSAVDDPVARAAAELSGTRTALFIPLRKDGTLLGKITASRREVKLFTEREIALLENFAAQAVIAMENARLITETREALEQQTATADVLKIISRSSVDLETVLGTLVETVTRLCRADQAAMYRRRDDKHHLVASCGLSEEAKEFFRTHPVARGRGTMSGRVELERRAVHIPDALQDPEYTFREGQKIGSYRTMLGIPLLRGDELVGHFNISRTRVEPYTNKEIELATTFADQAVIAIENARLFDELRERQAELARSVDELTATGDVLKIISRSSVELETVLDTLLETVARLCRADQSYMFRRRDDKYHLVTARGLSQEAKEFINAHPFAADRGSLSGRVELERQAVHIPDVLQDREYAYQGQKIAGYRTLLGLPLLRGDELIGIFIINRTRVEPYTNKEIELATTFADQAVIAIENARLFDELRERQAELARSVDELTATGDVLKIISRSSVELETVLDTLVETVARLCRADHALMYRRRDDRYHLVAEHGLSVEAKEFILAHPFAPDRGTAAGRAVLERHAVHIPDILQDPEYTYTGPKMTGARTLLGLPLLREDGLIGIFIAARTHVEPFAEKEIELATTFADQAVIAIENARLFDELRERQAELARSVDELTATGDVLKIISRSSVELETVLDTLVETVARLCRADQAVMFRRRDDLYHLATARGVPEEARQFILAHPLPADRGTLSGRVESQRRVVHIPDVLQDPDYTYQEVQKIQGHRTMLGVPLLRGDALLGILVINRTRVDPFADKEIELATSFADQAVIAIENARLFEELRERQSELARSVDELTATGDVLKIISRSSVDLETVLDTLVETVSRLCRGDNTTMYRRRDDLYHLVAAHGLSVEAKEFVYAHPLAPDRGTMSGRVAAERRAIHVPDVLQDPEYTYEGQKISGFRTMLGIPLLRADALIGIFVVTRTHVEPFTDKEIELATTFADQAVIAIENARLFEELRDRQAELARSVDELTATGDVLKIISRSSVDLETVLDTLVETVARLCRADQVGMFHRRDDKYHLVAAWGFSEEGKQFVLAHPVVPDRGTMTGRVTMERRAVHVPDVLQDPDYTYREGQKIGGYRTTLGIPLLREDSLIGIFSIFRTRVEPFTDKEIDLATTFADQAVIAIENARLFDELRDRQAELRVTFDNMGDGVAMFDADRRLVAWNRNFQEILDLPDAFLAERRTYVEYFRYLAERGEYSADLEEEIRRGLDDTTRELRYERTRPDGRVIEVRRNPVPGGGFVLIYADITERKRAEAAISAARDAAEAALRELQTAQASLVHAQKMAALGQLTAGIAHEIKNPLNFVNNFAGLSVELLDELREAAVQAIGTPDVKKRAEINETIEMLTGNLKKIAEHGRRADGIVKSMLQHSRGGSGDWQSTDLNALVDEALNLAYHGARAQDQSFNITFERDFDGNLTPIEVVPQDVMRVFLNLIGNGFYAADKRHREGDGGYRPVLKVTTRQIDDAVEVRVRDNGIGIAPEHREKLFQPFFTTKPTGEGTGLGLSISYEIVTLQHGGTITVESEVGQFTEFTVRLPQRRHSAAGRVA